MIRQRETIFGNDKKIVSEEIDTTALEVGDKFVLVERNPIYGASVIPLTVSKIGARDIMSVSPSGKKYRFNKSWHESNCYSCDSEFVSKTRLEIKKKSLFRELEKAGPGSVDSELLAALEAWSARQKTMNMQETQR